MEALCKRMKSELQTVYDLSVSDIRLLKKSENLTLLVTCTDDTRHILRINRPDYHTPEELNSELLWMEDIRDSTTILIPNVIRNRQGNAISSYADEKMHTQYYSIFSFLEGSVLHDVKGEALITMMEQVGALASTLHTQVQNSKIACKLKRFSWDYEDLLGENARFGQWEQHPALTSSQKKVLDQAVSDIRERLTSYGKESSRYGLIHSDLHLSNIMYHNGRLQLIDFDDCGFGWFLYECGCSLLEYNEHLEELRDAWLRGYQAIRPLTAADLKETDTFILLRRIVRIAWMQSHINTDTAASIDMEKYIDVTVKMAKNFIK